MLTCTIHICLLYKDTDIYSFMIKYNIIHSVFLTIYIYIYLYKIKSNLMFTHTLLCLNLLTHLIAKFKLGLVTCLLNKHFFQSRVLLFHKLLSSESLRLRVWNFLTSNAKSINYKKYKLEQYHI